MKLFTLALVEKVAFFEILTVKEKCFIEEFFLDIMSSKGRKI